jgi:hypothetical protein
LPGADVPDADGAIVKSSVELLCPRALAIIENGNASGLSISLLFASAVFDRFKPAVADAGVAVDVFLIEIDVLVRIGGVPVREGSHTLFSLQVMAIGLAASGSRVVEIRSRRTEDALEQMAQPSMPAAGFGKLMLSASAEFVEGLVEALCLPEVVIASE